jgi:site-specific recombinase XerD
MHSNATLNEELLKYFIEYLEGSTDKSVGTIANINRDIRAFIDYLAINDDASIQAKFITRYISELEEKYMESSFVTKLSSLRQFINWLNLEENPFWKLKFSFNYGELSYYKEEELNSRLREDFSYEELLIRVIYELYFSQDELIALNLENYNLASNSFICRDGKIEVSDTLAKLMRGYLKEYRPALLPETQSMTMMDPLFIGNNATGRRIEDADIHKVLQTYQLKHAQLKRSRIMNLLDQALSLEQIEEKLAIKLSNFYRPFVKEQDYRLAKAYRDFHPRSNL